MFCSQNELLCTSEQQQYLSGIKQIKLHSEGTLDLSQISIKQQLKQAYNGMACSIHGSRLAI